MYEQSSIHILLRVLAVLGLHAMLMSIYSSSSSSFEIKFNKFHKAKLHQMEFLKQQIFYFVNNNKV